MSAHAATRPADDSAGRALYGIISEVYADKSAGEAALESAISTLVTAIEQAAKTAEFDAVDVANLEEAEYGVEFAVDPSVKASTKMQDTMADIMSTLLKDRLGAGVAEQEEEERVGTTPRPVYECGLTTLVE